MADPTPYRRYGEYVPSACDAWNADEPLAEPEPEVSETDIDADLSPAERRFWSEPD